MAKGDKISGGLADKQTVSSIAKKHGVSVEHLKKQLTAGIKVESEHTDDPATAREIAMDHLFEDANYYIKLKTIEKGAKNYGNLVKKVITDKTGKKRTVWVRAGEKIKNYHKKQVDQYDHKEGASLLRKKLNGIVQGVKKEVHEWKEAGSGLGKFVSGKKMTEHEAKAIRTVALHVALVVAMSATGGKALAAKVLAKKLAAGYLEHAGLMRISHALAFSKAEEGSSDDAMHEHYIERLVLSMANYMEKEAKNDTGKSAPEEK